MARLTASLAVIVLACYSTDSQIIYQHCSRASNLGNLPAFSVRSFTSNCQTITGRTLVRVGHEDQTSDSQLESHELQNTIPRYLARPMQQPSRQPYSQTCVKQPYKTRHIFGFESSAKSSCRSFLRFFHSAIRNHLSIVISMSPEWMVAQNRFNCT